MIIYKEEEFCSINLCLFNVGKCTIGQLCLLLHLSLASLQLQLEIGNFFFNFNSKPQWNILMVFSEK